MQITINGTEETIEAEMSVEFLLAQRSLEPIRVAVEINEAIVPRGSYADTMICDGDRIEIVTFVGGG